MPDGIADLINDEGTQNKLIGVVPILASILSEDRRVESAYLCDEETTQIFKLPGEGNHFCGYRNIQMLLREQHSISELQIMIEKAWDDGYNSHSRTETGGIIGTRKHIGTSEVVLSTSDDQPTYADCKHIGASSFKESEHPLYCQSVFWKEGRAGAFGHDRELLHIRPRAHVR